MESRPGAVSLRELQSHDPARVGPYTLDAKIGEGGMGAVYLGRGADGRRVAVKVVRPELAGDRAFVARFNDECRNAERVASFCTAQVLDHGQDLGMAYMVTEYIEGPSLLQHINDQGTLSPGLLHGVAVGVAAALVAIHSAGLVHRDLKPSNVLLSISGPRVIDFGIARALDMATSHTATGQVVGTPGYIAPEQILTQKITPAVDVFAWGCLIAYAANGRNPFGQGSIQVMVGRALHADPELGALTDPLAALVRAALGKEPETRPTAQELLLSLVGGGAGESEVTTTLGESWTTPPAPRRPTPDRAPTPPPPDRTSTPPPAAASPAGPPSPPSAGAAPPRNPAPSPPAPAPSPPVAAFPPPGPEPSPAASAAPSSSPAPSPPAPASPPPGPAPSPPAGAAQSPSPAPSVPAPASSPGGSARSSSPAASPLGPAASPSGAAFSPPAGAAPSSSPASSRSGGRGAEVRQEAGAGSRAAAEPGTEPAGETVTDPAAYRPGPVQAPPARPGRPGRRRNVLVAGAVAGVGVVLAGAGLLAAMLGDEPAKRAPAAQPEGPPVEPMLVRIDTKAGWPEECHGDIGTYTPGQDAAVPLVTGNACDMLPERSPDGRTVAFTRRSGDRNEAWLVNADGSDPRRVTDRLAGGRVAWSPDGRRLAFMGKEGGVRQIYTITIGETAPRRLTSDGADKDDPMWSSTGRLAFWSKRDGTQAIFTLDPRNPGAWQKVTTDGVAAADPEWSPDGTKIAYTRGAYPEADVWVVNADGSGARRVTAGAEHEMDAAWSRDGKWICYARGPYEKPEIRTVKADGTGDRPFGPKTGTVGHPSWS
ncbi:protein kinase [Actinomadura sp. 21ATH]|uniref:protein kinase domain-containing protein n=1 Tax=Actinomadura sp. 21ATH TaxID=1735444 RepID=UPI0035C04C42